MPYVKVLIDYEEERALINASIRERRYPPQQIAYVLRRWLEDNRLLPNPTETGPEVQLEQAA